VIGKARSATVDSRVRRTGRDDVDADRMRDLIPTSEGWSCKSYNRAVKTFIHEDSKLKLDRPV